jgi:hypothetical protein
MSDSGSGLMRFGRFAVLKASKSLSCSWCACPTASSEKPLVMKSTCHVVVQVAVEREQRQRSGLFVVHG